LIAFYKYNDLVQEDDYILTINTSCICG